MEPQSMIPRKHFEPSNQNKDDIEAEWTKLLLEWVRICGQIRTSLDQVDFVDLLRTYGGMSDMSVQCEPLREDLDRFLQQKFPKLDLSFEEGMSRKPYITATVLLYHCIISGPVNVVINICLYLTLTQQTMVQRFCEVLRDKEVTVANIDAAVAGVFEGSSEMLGKHEKQNVAAGLWSAVAKQNVNDGSLIPETSFNDNGAPIIVSGLDMASSEVEKIEKSCNVISIDLEAETISTTYVISTLQSESFVCQYPYETRIDTTNVIVGATDIVDKKVDNNNRVSLGKFKLTDSKAIHSETIMRTQEVCPIEGHNDEVMVACDKIKKSLENNYYEPKSQSDNRTGSKIPLHLRSIISFNYLNKNTSKIRTSKSDNYDKLHSTKKEAYKTVKSKSMTFYCPESFDPTISLSKYSEEINMLYLNSSFVQKSSVFVYPEQPNYKVTVINATVSTISESKAISKYEIENITYKTSNSLAEPEKLLTNNATIILDTPVLESGFSSKSAVIKLPGNIKTPLLQNPVPCLQNSADDINSVGDEEIEKEMKDAPNILKKLKRQKIIEIVKVHDTPSTALDEAVDALLDAVDTVYFKSQRTGKSSFSGYCIRIWSEVKKTVSSLVLLRKKSRIVSQGNFGTTCEKECGQEYSNKSMSIIEFVDRGIKPPFIHTETKRKRKGNGIENSNTSFGNGNSVNNKWFKMNILKDSVKKRDMKEKEANYSIEGETEYHCANYIDNYEDNPNRKEKRQVFFSHTSIQGQPTRRAPRVLRNGINPTDYWKMYVSICAILIMFSLLIILLIVLFGTWRKGNTKLFMDVDGYSRSHDLINEEEKLRIVQHVKMNPFHNWPCWECSNGLCKKADQTEIGCYESLSRCTLLCSGPQLWPLPTGHTYFGNELVALGKNKLRYKYNRPSPGLVEYLDEAIYLFHRNLARLEVTKSTETAQIDLALKDVYIEIVVESNLGPKLRVDTNESYSITVETVDEIKVAIKSPSFHGVRHGLETLSQLILLDQSTGYLITLTNVTIKDAPSFKYRGLMIDTSGNHIPLTDLLRTVDAMSMCKLNTFHWRISKVTFPILISKFPTLFENNVNSTEMVYSTEDIKTVVKNAGFRGIRVIVEVASPVPVVSNTSSTTNVSKETSGLISDALCLKMKASDSIFDVLQTFYSYIIKLTNLQDIFHLSNSLLVYVACFDLLEERERFLERAQAHLASANSGTVPKLPVIWYNANITSQLGWMWYDFGVQLFEDKILDVALDKYKLIESGPWDLSCKIMNKQTCMKYSTWHQLYEWKKRWNLEAWMLEGGEALLWLDMVDTDNLDSLLWPRMTAVAERFWADAVANQHASAYDQLRLDAQRWRMMLRGVEVQATWPAWCDDDPSQCLSKINT